MPDDSFDLEPRLLGADLRKSVDRTAKNVAKATVQAALDGFGADVRAAGEKAAAKAAEEAARAQVRKLGEDLTLDMRAQSAALAAQEARLAATDAILKGLDLGEARAVYEAVRDEQDRLRESRDLLRDDLRKARAAELQLQALATQLVQTNVLHEAATTEIAKTLGGLRSDLDARAGRAAAVVLADLREDAFEAVRLACRDAEAAALAKWQEACERAEAQRLTYEAMLEASNERTSTALARLKVWDTEADAVVEKAVNELLQRNARIETELVRKADAFLAGEATADDAPLVPRAYRGPYKDGTTYQRGDLVTFFGSTFIAVQATSERPFASINPDVPWQLFAAGGFGGGFASNKLRHQLKEYEDRLDELERVTTPIPPSNQMLPMITGPNTPGGTYLVTPGRWYGIPTPTRMIQWMVNGNIVPGEEGLSFTPVPILVPGDDVRCRETATNYVGTSTVYSDGITIVGTPPVNVIRPTITGPTTPSRGPYVEDTIGTWTGNPTPVVTRQWTLNGIDAPGATSQVFAPANQTVPGDVISMHEIATNGVGPPVIADATNPITVVLAPPVNLTPPVIDGPLVTTPGATYSVTAPGTWSGNPVPTISYQWQLNGTDVAGETGTSFTPVPDLVQGDSVDVREIAVNGGVPVSALSNVISIELNMVNTVRPLITGPTTPGVAPYTVTPGTWTGPAGIVLTYQWTRNAADIAGATGPTWVPATATLPGDVIDIKETASDGLEAPVTVTASNPISVQAVPPVNTRAPTITGPTVPGGGTYTVTVGIWTGNPTPSIARQWYRNDQAVAGATGTSYTPSPGPAHNDRFYCRETATNGGGTAAVNSNIITVQGTAPYITSGSTAIYGPGNAGTTGPWDIDGLCYWGGNPTPSLEFQWYRSGNHVHSGLSYTSSSPVQAGERIQLREYATNAAGSGESWSGTINIT